MSRVFPLAILISLAGVSFPVNHQDAGIVRLCCTGTHCTHRTCPSWTEARSLARLEWKIHWQTSKCHFMVTQDGHFLIPHEEKLSLDTSSGLGYVAVAGDTKILWLVPLPPFPRTVPETPKNLQQLCWDRARDASSLTPPPTFLPSWSILTWCNLPFSPPQSPSSAPAPSSPRLAPSGPPQRQCCSSYPQGKAFGKCFL